jgi:DNA-binding XRE family transcriptional regulator
MDDNTEYEIGEAIEGIGHVVSIESKNMYLTSNHSSSSYGFPVFLDADGNPIDYAPGLQLLRKDKKWSVRDAANQVGVSPRTWEGWEQGRMPSKTALLLLSHLI